VLVTDAAGNADATVPTGGSISAFHAEDLSFQIQTVVAPPDGGALVFEFYVAAPPPSELPTTYSIYPNSYPAGTTTLELRGPCTAVTTAPGSKFPDVDNETCTGSPQDFLMVARSSTNAMLGSGTLLDAPTNPGGILDFSVSVNDTTLSSITSTIADIPASASLAQVGGSVGVGNLSMHVFATDTNPSTTFMSTLQVPAIPNFLFGWVQGVFAGDNFVGSSVTRHSSSTQLPSSSSFSAGSFTWLSVNPLDVRDPVHPLVTWSSSDEPTADVLKVEFGWQGGTSTVTIVARLPPHSATSLRLPDIPDELSGFRPVATSTFEGVSVICTDYDALADFADVVDGYTLADELSGSTRSSGYNSSP
jgi:hypothetical protein